MGLHPNFPQDPYEILDPEVRWLPDQDNLVQTAENLREYTGQGESKKKPSEKEIDDARRFLIPPLVDQIRKGVKAWRDSGYSGASETTRALMHWWFDQEHEVTSGDGHLIPFRYYFAQREAAESAIWLHEVEQAKDPYALMRYDSSGLLSQSDFDGDWTRYTMKLATGTGKTKVMSLLMAWSYFHKLYEEGSDLSQNFLLIAPNIIVLERLKRDFGGLDIFMNDPVIPPDGFEGRSWKTDFSVSVHYQDDVFTVNDRGNIFLTNIHRVFSKENKRQPAFNGENNFTDYFLGKAPKSGNGPGLWAVLRTLTDLLILNDEAHHIHDEELEWHRSIEDIVLRLRQQGSDLSAQFDFTATPKRINNGAIFAQTICDYPLVEAVAQGIVKKPVLPDLESRELLQEKPSIKASEKYHAYIRLGYLEWRDVYKKHFPEKKSVLFIMTEDTKSSDDIGKHLQETYPEFADPGSVLVIHTKNNGEISEQSTGKKKQELDKLRRMSHEIDDPTNPCKAVVSVMMLREGWDVRNVVTVVGLRPYKAKSKILPEQALGRGLRLMFPGEQVEERVSVIGTRRFVEFVEQIKSEGVELEYAKMGLKCLPTVPLYIEVRNDLSQAQQDKLDIRLPVLSPRIRRTKSDLLEIDVDALPSGRKRIKDLSNKKTREIVFKDMVTDEKDHTTEMEQILEPVFANVVGYFARKIVLDLRLIGHFDDLCEKMRDYIESRLFLKPVSADDENILRNLCEPAASQFLLDTFKKAINSITVEETPHIQVTGEITVGKTKRQAVKRQDSYRPKRSLLSPIVTVSGFEMEFAKFLDRRCKDIQSFVRNLQYGLDFHMEYQSDDASIRRYYPDFIVKVNDSEIWIVETKGLETTEAPIKWKRLCQWCNDASESDIEAQCMYKPLYVKEDIWREYNPKNFVELCELFSDSEAIPEN